MHNLSAKAQSALPTTHLFHFHCLFNPLFSSPNAFVFGFIVYMELNLEN